MSGADRVTLVLPAPPSIGNASHAHYMMRARAKRAYKKHALALEKRLHMGRPPAPWARVRCTARLFTWNRLDDDNAPAALKWAIDLLKGTWIVDDRRPYFELLPVEQTIDRQRPRLELTLEKV